MKTYALAWIALVLLTTTSWISTSFTGMAFGLAIGAVKGAIIAAVFMHLAHGRTTERLALAAAALFIAIFAGIMALDPLTR